MSRFQYDYFTRKLVNAQPLGATIPESAYRYNQPPIYVRSSTGSSPVLSAFAIIFIILTLIAIGILLWWFFLKDRKPIEV